jgi:hypothetical protein
MTESKSRLDPWGPAVTDARPLRAEARASAVLRAIAVRDREKFAEDLTEVFCAKSEAHGLRAFWELVVRWERFYPSVVQTLERQLGGTPYPAH